jgi:hypothetical protein
MSKDIEHMLKARLPQNIDVNGLSFLKIEPSTRSLAVYNVHFALTQAENVYKVSADRVLFVNTFCLVAQKECHLLIENLNVENKDLKVIGVEGRFIISPGSNEALAGGLVTIDQIRYNEYLIEHVYSNITIDNKNVIFGRILARAYQGRLQGEGAYQLLPKEQITMTLDFKDIDTNRIQSVNSQLRGALTGQVSYSGTITSIDSLTVNFRSPSSEMEKTLLKYLMGNINDSLAFLPFSKALESADFIHLDNFQGTIHNAGKDSVDIQLNVNSKQLNLDLNPTITINLR